MMDRAEHVAIITGSGRNAVVTDGGRVEATIVDQDQVISSAPSRHPKQ